MKNKIIPFVMFLFGALMGVVSKLLDIHTQNLGNIFSQMSIWILLGTLIAIFSKTKGKAALNVFVFCVGMLITIGGFGPTIAAILVLPNKSPKETLKFVFSGKKNSFWYLLLFCAIQGLIIGISSREPNPAIPWFVAPIVMFSATVVGGGNEEMNEAELKYYNTVVNRINNKLLSI